MKYFFLLFFLIFVSCSSSKHTYMCGDQACLDKKEFKKYFAQTLTLEIKAKKKKKDSSINLVKLNIKEEEVNIKKTSTKTQDKKIERNRLKEEKTMLKNKRKIKKNNLKKERVRLKNERKIEKNKAKEERKIAELNEIPLENEQKKKQEIQIMKGDKSNKKESFVSIRSKNQPSICEELADCDIDKIFEVLIKKGKEKNFPNITLK